MLKICIIILLGIILCLGGIDLPPFLIKRKNKRKPATDFELLKKEVQNSFSQKLATRLEAERVVYETSIATLLERKKVLEESIVSLDLDYKEKTEELKHSFSLSNQQLEQQKEELTKKKDEEFCLNLQQKQKEFLKKENELKKLFDEKHSLLEQKYNETAEDYTKQLKEYSSKIEEQRKLQEEVISRLKKDEEIRQQQEFYKVKLDAAATEDISKLQAVATQLSNPTAIYKVIWEVFYKAKFNEMMGRVIEDKDCGGIYKITNIINGKTYIGKTVNFKTRWTTHAKRALRCETFSSNKLYTEMWELGLHNFSFEIVEICGKEKQTEREKFWIGYYKSNEYGYNTQS